MGNWLPARRYGCPGIIASNCHPLTYDDDLVWPKRTDSGHGWVTLIRAFGAVAAVDMGAILSLRERVW